jgi:hypothetical protein
MLEEAGPGLIAMRERRLAVLRPPPIGTQVQLVRQGPDQVFVLSVAIEVGGGGQCAGQQESRVDGGELAPPGPSSGLHVEKVIVKAFVAGCVRRSPLHAVAKESQGRQRDRHRGVTRHEATLHANGVGREREAGRRNTGGPAVSRLVGDQPIERIDLFQEVFERLALEPVQQGVIIR